MCSISGRCLIPARSDLSAIALATEEAESVGWFSLGSIPDFVRQLTDYDRAS